VLAERDVAFWALAELSVDHSLPALLDRLRAGDVDARLQAALDTLFAHLGLLLDWRADNGDGPLRDLERALRQLSAAGS
jgi:hypothetical protein